MCSLCVHTFLILTWGLSCRLRGRTWSWLGCHLSLTGSGCSSALGRSLPLGLLAADTQLPKTGPHGAGWAQRCPGTPCLPLHCFMPLRGAAKGRKSAAVAPLLCLEDVLHPPCAFGWAFCNSAIMIWLENSCPQGWVCFKTGEQLYGVGPAVSLGEREDRACVFLL